MGEMTTPEKSHREALGYAVVRTTVSMSEIGAVLPQLWPEISTWLSERGIEKAGNPFIHYHNMAAQLDISVGIPTVSVADGDFRVETGSFPTGDYVSGTMTGPYDGLPAAHEALHSWATQNGLTLTGPTEFYSDPAEDPPSEWQTEIVYAVA